MHRGVQDKWKGVFQVKWIYIKDIGNQRLRHITMPNNENKPVTNSRDTQEILLEPGRQLLQVFATFRERSSLLDEFSAYERLEELRTGGKPVAPIQPAPPKTAPASRASAPKTEVKLVPATDEELW